MATTSPRPRWLTGVVHVMTLTLVAVLLTTMAPAATAAVARNIDSACPPGQVPSAGFRDTAGSTFVFEIDCIVAYGVAQGTSPTTYRPGDTVTRGQMASFLARVLVAAGRARPADLPDRFRDDDRTQHEANIDWLAHEGVVSGFTDGTYRPAAPVTRAQMATFLSNVLLELDGRRPTSPFDEFWDDDGDHHEANIDGLAAEGIATGIGGNRFDPAGFVTRQQMAGFLARELDYLVDAGRVRALGRLRVQDFGVSPTTAVSLPTSDVTTTSLANRGARSYTATIPTGITSVNLMLLPTSSVVTGSDGLARFTSATPLPANAGTGFEVVNGSTLDTVNGSNDRTTLVGVTVPANRLLTFTVDSIVPRAAVPVWYEDLVAPAADQLDLEAPPTAGSPQHPVERFGLGGAVTWQLPEPATGTNPPPGTVREVNLAASTYTLDVGGSPAPEYLIRFPVGDTFTYTAGVNRTLTRAEFQTWLSVGDRVDPGTYRPGQTLHVLVGDVPNAPTNVVATAVNLTDVQVTFTKPTNPVASLSSSSYRLQRAPVTSGVVGTYTEVASITGEKVASFTNKPPKGVWSYRVVARSATGDSPPSAATTVTTLQPPEPVTGTNPPAGTVREVNLASSYYTLDTGGTAEPEFLIRFPVGDTFSYTAGLSRALTRAEFQAWLSVGDRVDPGVYRPGQTLHVITGDVPNAPTGVAASVVDGTDVRVTFVKPTNPIASLAATTYRLHRAPVTGGVVGTYVALSSTSTGVQAAELTDKPAQGIWSYRVVATTATGSSPPSNAATVTTGASSVAPATTASALTDTATPGELSKDDRLTFTFDRAITVASNWTLDLVDHQGDQGRLSAATATAAVSGTAGNVLTLTLTSGPVLLNQPSGSSAIIDTATFLQVRQVTGIGNAAGGWNLPRSGLASTYNNSRVVAGRPATPVEPGGSLTVKVGTAALLAGVNEAQNLRVSSTAGTYTLELGAAETAALAFDANAAAIQSALEAIPAIGPGNVEVSGNATATDGALIRFRAALSATDVAQLVATGTGLSAGGSVTVTTTVPGAAVTGIVAGDTVRVFTTGGLPLGSATAGPNGLTTVVLSQTVVTGQQVYVVVDQLASGRASRTALLTATP